MAGLTSGDRSHNGAVEGHGTEARPDEQTLSDRDQTLADADQTLADADQTESDADQSAADVDQAAADSDQAASDRDFEHGGDADVHGETRNLRNRNAQRRGKTADRRYTAATQRDEIADERDLIARERDRAADQRDRELAELDAAWEGDAAATAESDVLRRATEDRRRARADRAAAAADRARAAADRERAARERERARADREALMQQVVAAETDALTGARTRGAGLADLDHEVDRARRTNEQLAVAYIDLVGLKQVNDTRGHAAGDALLQRVADAIRGQLRSYDLLVRVGGDEFVCALSRATLQDARARFTAVRATLATPPDPCEIKVGLAQLEPDVSAEDLIALADADLPDGRSARPA